MNCPPGERLGRGRIVGLGQAVKEDFRPYAVCQLASYRPNDGSSVAAPKERKCLSG